MIIIDDPGLHVNEHERLALAISFSSASKSSDSRVPRTLKLDVTLAASRTQMSGKLSASDSSYPSLSCPSPYTISMSSYTNLR